MPLGSTPNRTRGSGATSDTACGHCPGFTRSIVGAPGVFGDALDALGAGEEAMVWSPVSGEWDEVAQAVRLSPAERTSARRETRIMCDLETGCCECGVMEGAHLGRSTWRKQGVGWAKRPRLDV